MGLNADPVCSSRSKLATASAIPVDRLAPSVIYRVFDPDRLFMMLTILLGIIAVFFRWKNLGTQSLWLDEGYTLWIARFSPRQIVEILKVDESAPFYYF